MTEKIVVLVLAIVTAIASLVLKSKITIIISDPSTREMSQNYFREKARKLELGG